MTLPEKIYNRSFSLHAYTPPVDQWVWEVIDSIENDEMMVFDPGDEDALNYVMVDGAESLDGGLVVPVSIREWLCVGCQSISWETPKGDGTLLQEDVIAAYGHNIHDVIVPTYSSFMPAGPGAFTGEIRISERTHKRICCKDMLKYKNYFKCIIAHELTHVFDAMRIVIPAFMNWKLFWTKVLNEGSCCDVVADRFRYRNMFVDHYGEEDELEMLRMYWPSSAEKWFDASRGADS